MYLAEKDSANRTGDTGPTITRSALTSKHLLFIVLVAVALRSIRFGDPIIQIDEEFYLLAGDRLLHGLLPYVDIWDRKPFGLFLIYAAIRLLGGAGLVEYQLVATAAATAIVIARIALRLTNAQGATIAALVYLVFILSSGGDGGQAPVFYNLPVAIAALIVLKVQERRSLDGRAFGLGCLAMGVLGLAIQIKYTVIFEGIFFGLYLLTLAWRRRPRPLTILALALSWCAIALLPTVSVGIFYWQRGSIDQFLFANFYSVFIRSGEGLDIPRRLFVIVAHIALPLAGALWASRATVEDRAAHRFVGLWALTAVIALVLFGTYHAHYALPLFVPLAVAGAPIYAVRLLRRGRFHPTAGHAIVLIGLVAGIVSMAGDERKHGRGEAVRAAATMVGQSPRNCIFVFNGDPILYHLTNSCLPTRFVFPTFLSERSDHGSLGRDSFVELRSVMKSRPEYVFTREQPPRDALLRAWVYMDGVLKRDYRPRVSTAGRQQRHPGIQDIGPFHRMTFGLVGK